MIIFFIAFRQLKLIYIINEQCYAFRYVFVENNQLNVKYSLELNFSSLQVIINLHVDARNSKMLYDRDHHKGNCEFFRIWKRIYLISLSDSVHKRR